MALMHLNVTDLEIVARNGAGLIVSASRLTPTDLATVAKNLRGSAVLHVTDCGMLSAQDMGTIARNAHSPAFVMFS